MALGGSVVVSKPQWLRTAPYLGFRLLAAVGSTSCLSILRMGLVWIAWITGLVGDCFDIVEDDAGELWLLVNERDGVRRFFQLWRDLFEDLMNEEW
ncbi:hypothetical protein AYL99_00875 [Fonsecaea erecta]|uniref:Uncharacterized protein n=1 Tax=Fonsecaea erecta TaxID=1367422 RepID=A0A179A0E8_9EURO|nr:hypothetical protein AYL99_00875 [Fonsecaea erecta]OAP64903.1 hypothetical protein AYL99_00875 [Fonsecaea erecta]